MPFIKLFLRCASHTSGVPSTPARMSGLSKPLLLFVHGCERVRNADTDSPSSCLHILSSVMSMVTGKAAVKRVQKLVRVLCSSFLTLSHACSAIRWSSSSQSLVTLLQSMLHLSHEQSVKFMSGWTKLPAKYQKFITWHVRIQLFYRGKRGHCRWASSPIQFCVLLKFQTLRRGCGLYLLFQSAMQKGPSNFIPSVSTSFSFLSNVSLNWSIFLVSFLLNAMRCQ